MTHTSDTSAEMGKPIESVLRIRSDVFARVYLPVGWNAFFRCISVTTEILVVLLNVCNDFVLGCGGDFRDDVEEMVICRYVLVLDPKPWTHLCSCD